MNLIDRIAQAIPDRPSDASGSAPVFEDNPPTERVAILCASDAAPAPPVDMTPPPVSHRKLAAIASVIGTELSGDSKEVRFPAVGSAYHGFRLVEELGRGAFARVYLAEQTALAGRRVALKVTLRATHEAERLARLQHTNIVPVYSVHDAAPVQLICMPFVGRQTIADCIRAYRNELSTRSAVAHRNTSQVARADKTTALAGNQSRRMAAPASGAYTRPHVDEEPVRLVREPLTVLAVLSRLAAGLSHAHARKILHLDLKPANVLLADDGEPMLLDFNLSFDTTAPAREMVGGTLPYMAIEQLIDLKSHGKGKVDERTDLYSLGVMAFEMLTGEVPFPAQPRADIAALVAGRRAGAPSIRVLNPAVSPAVEAIVLKLLAPDPANRYQSAADLQTDVDRHLNNLPLQVIPEPSLLERAAKWKRRNPGVLFRGLLACAIGLVLGLGTVAYMRAEGHAKVIASAQARTARAGFGGTRLDLIVPNDPVARARGIKRAEELLERYGSPDEANWAEGAEVARLGDADRAALAGDLRELRALLALAKGEPAGEFKADGDPSPARERFVQAARAIVEEKFAVAAPLLEKVVAAEPGHAAAQFCLGYCRQKLGSCDRALERYEVAAPLLPADPRPSFQRGVVFALKGHPAEAETELTRAIELDGEHALAFRNRGFARYRLEKFTEAEADLTRALDLGGSAFTIHTYRAQVRRALGNEAGAAEDERTVANAVPQHEADFVARGVSRLKNNKPEDALADFDAALKLNPRSLTALKNKLHALADSLDRQRDALTVATQLTELYPEFTHGRMGRAVVLARLGQRTDAHAEATKALDHAKGDYELTYLAACVYALTAKDAPGDQAKALDLLHRSIKQGFHSLQRLESDRDLAAVRRTPRFIEILGAAKQLFQ